MNISGIGDSVTVPELILRLCTHFSKNNQALTSRLYQTAISFVQTSNGICPKYDEEFVISEMKTFLSSSNPSKSSLENFGILLSTVNNSSILHHKDAVLSFLMNVAKMNSVKDNLKLKVLQNFEKVPFSQSVMNSKSHTTVNSVASQESIRNLYQGNINDRPFSRSSRNESTSNTNIMGSIWSRQEFGSSLSKSTNLTLISEVDLLQDIIYSLQGIEGKFIKKEPGGLGFIIDQKTGRNFTPIQKGLTMRLLGLSFLHNRLKQYCEENDKQRGTMSQALISIIRDELSAYYKTVALLQANMKKQGSTENSDMSLRRALYIVQDHTNKFEWLAYIAEECSDKKGGALVTVIHGYLQHGSICVQETCLRSYGNQCYYIDKIFSPPYVQKHMLTKKLRSSCLIDCGI
ncbi:hypothetical protein HHI36_005108 [Cryptolaemus montrouzieri]|uniref:Gamma tubulin complex component protein N-terminal domain-containing protein n=1 Tax=Cryptolaemus montrouzieri TaxID=559131 RepID=A0ABD2NTK3_9CUCU